MLLMQDIMEINQNVYDDLSSDFIKDLKNIDIYETITVTESNYIDMIAKNTLGSEKYWWILCYYNNIIDPINYVTPLNLKIPNITEVEKLKIKYKSNN